jgi:NTP pyrophosphatase (non-canonical NTP hydrolase)
MMNEILSKRLLAKIAANSLIREVLPPPNPKPMKTTTQLVEEWAEEKGILSKATPLTQAIKTQEEVNELYQAILDNNREEIKDAIGDIMVTLIIQCKMQGMDLQDCLESAYNVIKNRTGKMVDGMFVKD